MRLSIVVALALAFLAVQVHGKGVDEESQSITVPIYQEPRILDSTSAPTVEFTAEILVHIQEGLMSLDARGNVVGGVAESWEMTPSQLRFQLRDDARWANGEPVTASDFVFAWQKLVSPAAASPSANLAAPIRNAIPIIRGELGPETLGVRAASPNELIVELEHPCSWCLNLMTTSAFYPVNQEFHRNAGDNYGTSASTHLSNGPFKLQDWQRGKRLLLVRNEAYWGNESVHLNQIDYGYIASDAKTMLNLYRSGDIALARLDRDTVADAMQLGQRIRTGPTGYLMHLQFSHIDGMASANEHIRKAVAAVIDKGDLVNRVIATPGTRSADSMFHEWLTVGEQKFSSLLTPVPHKADLAVARQHLEQGKRELGIEGPVTLTFTVFDNRTSRGIAEYLQNRLALIGVELKIDQQNVQMLLDKWFRGVSDITLIGWILDVDDPIDQLSFLGNPDIRNFYQGLYRGEDMTAIYYDYRDAPSQVERERVVKRAHEFLTERVTVFPLFESYHSTVIDPRLGGYVFQPVRGFSDYRFVRIRQSL